MKGYHTCLVRRISNDGIHWQERETLLDYADSTCLATVGDMVRSPAVLWQDNRYKMWFVDNADPKGVKHVCYSESPDGYCWTSQIVCDLAGSSVEPWHLDLNVFDGEYVLTVYDFQDLTLWRSYDGRSFEFSNTLLSPSGVNGSFYSDGLYRSSIVRDSEGFKLYFSAFDDKRTNIGLMTGANYDELSVYSANGPYVSLAAFVRPFIMIWKVRIWRLLQNR